MDEDLTYNTEWYSDDLYQMNEALEQMALEEQNEAENNGEDDDSDYWQNIDPDHLLTDSLLTDSMDEEPYPEFDDDHYPDYEDYPYFDDYGY